MHVLCMGCLTHSPGVKRPSKAAASFMKGTYGMGMQMWVRDERHGVRTCWGATWVCHVVRPAAAIKLTIRAATT